jgi:hypothetical protein
MFLSQVTNRTGDPTALCVTVLSQWCYSGVWKRFDRFLQVIGLQTESFLNADYSKISKPTTSRNFFLYRIQR